MQCTDPAIALLIPARWCPSASLQEPLLQAMELLQHTDVLLGMHGAGWTNGMFIKHGAVAMQVHSVPGSLPLAAAAAVAVPHSVALPCLRSHTCCVWRRLSISWCDVLECLI